MALVDEPYHQGEQCAGNAAGNHGKRRCPQLLADRAKVSQQSTGKHKKSSDDEQPFNFIVEVVDVHNDLTHAEANEYMTKGGRRGEQA